MTVSIEVADGSEIRLRSSGEVVATIPRPIEARSLGSVAVRGSYDSVSEANGAIVGTSEWAVGGAQITVTDQWITDGEQRVILQRSVRSSGISPSGLQLALAVHLPEAADRRYFAPGMVYSPEQWATGGTYSYCDSRLAYPVVAAIGASGVISLMRLNTALVDSAPVREPGSRTFLQRTQIGSVGFNANANALIASWPYFEGDRSALLDAARHSASAFFPLDRPLDETLSYAIDVSQAEDHAEAIRSIFEQAVENADPSPARVDVELPESVDLRLDSAAKTFRRSAHGFAGFVLNFDPERGYESDPKAFGASFAEHAMSGTHDILEYGFTGRQLNLAYMLAKRAPEEWAEPGAAVVDSFVSRMTTPSGWVHTLWDFAADEAVFACGDSRGVVMHYLGASDLPGTYTRMMAEVGRDLLLNVALHRELGADTSGWLAAATALGGFFLRSQEPDGSWFRAYAPTGEPIVESDWFGYRSGSGKTATAAVIPFLTALARAIDEAPDHSVNEEDRVRTATVLDSARRAGNYVRESAVDPDEYRGGTLDNPNVVDKEAAFIVMQAMLALFDVATGAADPAEAADRLASARRAAIFAITWHSLWAVPAIEGTRLATENVHSVGWGGINSVWGVGVTDIYSLFFLADLVRLGRLTDEPLFGRIAELAAWSSVQLLSTEQAGHGFVDSGMQPEGISFCSQGEDDGLIRKGDIWGGLGWPYTAGTHGLETYLRERDRGTGATAGAQ
jgi:hypothetical protein